ncbi:methylenetetrahydrofolate reductase [Catenulispora pinisilvae]|uniref:methylenetetrahydrofolate reductase n=1 Tax=Catenulispora pinisilvae TaxID=2705253 RepID=UPI00189265CD|nr:methylenetetrahydrofolate reductase [Catenulispora pinisilvae]
MSLASSSNPLTIGPVLADATIEIIPLKGAQDQIQAAPAAATVAITCSPRFGLDRTLQFCAVAADSGRRVVPHLAARMVTSRRELTEFVSRIQDLGITDLYVIGGDSEKPAGPYSEAGQVLEDLHEHGHALARLGVSCYPEGHPLIGDDQLWAALERKQQLATYMVSQMCFDGVVVRDWLAQARQRGISLPLRAGVAGPVKLAKLAELSLRIGVGQSLRYLGKQHGMVGNVLRRRAYDPSPFISVITGMPGVEGLHFFSFNQVPEYVAWRDARRDSGDTSPQ